MLLTLRFQHREGRRRALAAGLMVLLGAAPTALMASRKGSPMPGLTTPGSDPDEDSTVSRESTRTGSRPASGSATGSTAGAAGSPAPGRDRYGHFLLTSNPGDPGESTTIPREETRSASRSASGSAATASAGSPAPGRDRFGYSLLTSPQSDPGEDITIPRGEYDSDAESEPEPVQAAPPSAISLAVLALREAGNISRISAAFGQSVVKCRRHGIDPALATQSTDERTDVLKSLTRLRLRVEDTISAQVFELAGQHRKAFLRAGAYLEGFNLYQAEAEDWAITLFRNILRLGLEAAAEREGIDPARLLAFLDGSVAKSEGAAPGGAPVDPAGAGLGLL